MAAAPLTVPLRSCALPLLPAEVRLLQSVYHYTFRAVSAAATRCPPAPVTRLNTPAALFTCCRWSESRRGSGLVEQGLARALGYAFVVMER